jgi:hypothetical protein
MQKIIAWLLLLIVTAGAKTASLQSVRDLIENKEVDQAVAQLLAMHPKQLHKDEDVARVGKWLSVFLYDDTVALYEKAIEQAAKGDAEAHDNLLKAKEKEPHNKILRQSLISYLVDQQKNSEAQELITESQKAYPYFKVYSIYERYVQLEKKAPADKKATAKDDKICALAQLSEDEKDFCRLVSLREMSLQKIKIDKKRLETAKKIKLPEALFVLWEMTSSTEYLKQYMTKCQGLTDQQKRSARLFPGVCSKVKDVEPLLKKQEPEE